MKACPHYKASNSAPGLTTHFMVFRKLHQVRNNSTELPDCNKHTSPQISFAVQPAGNTKAFMLERQCSKLDQQKNAPSSQTAGTTGSLALWWSLLVHWLRPIALLRRVALLWRIATLRGPLLRVALCRVLLLLLLRVSYKHQTTVSAMIAKPAIFLEVRVALTLWRIACHGVCSQASDLMV